MRTKGCTQRQALALPLRISKARDSRLRIPGLEILCNATMRHMLDASANTTNALQPEVIHAAFEQGLVRIAWNVLV